MFFRCAFSRILGALFATALVSFSSGAFAQVNNQVNVINNGSHITGGTYINTPGNRTIFTNNGANGLWLHSGGTIRGLETSGGTIHINAPGSLVRIDGNIDVSAIRNGQFYTGNGGRIYVDSAYLFHNGTIFANGHHNNRAFTVSSFTLGPAGVHAFPQIHAGIAPLGNHLASMEPAPAQLASVVDMSGKVIGKYDASLIAVKGGLINLNGIAIADGLKKQVASGTTSVVLLASEQPKVAAQESLNTSRLGEEPQANLVAGKAPLKSLGQQWLSLEPDAPIKAH